MKFINYITNSKHDVMKDLKSTRTEKTFEK